MKNWFLEDQEAYSGLVLGGGGARGCYEIGVWKALDEQHLSFDCTAGTSIGALVSAMYVQGSLEAMIAFVQTLKPTTIVSDLFAFPETLGALVSSRKEIGSFLQKYIFDGNGVDISPLKQALDQMFDWHAFHTSPINYACMTFNLTKHTPQAYFKAEMTPQNAQDIILASASCYPAFPVLKMHGEDYIDGGYWDNVPIDLAQKMKATKILAVDVQGPGLVLPVDRNQINLFEMKPLLPLGNFLDFSSLSAMRNLWAGYLETSKAMQTLTGFFYTFECSEAQDIAFWSGYLSFLFSLHRIVFKPEVMETIAHWAFDYSPSDLSKTLAKDKGPWLLIESLAYVAGLDPYHIWSVSDFLSQLHQKLEAFYDKVDDLTDLPTLSSLWGRKDLDKMAIITLFYKNLFPTPLEASQKLAPFGSVYPGEVALAWTWYFLEVVYGRTKA